MKSSYIVPAREFRALDMELRTYREIKLKFRSVKAGKLIFLPNFIAAQSVYCLGSDVTTDV